MWVGKETGQEKAMTESERTGRGHQANMTGRPHVIGRQGKRPETPGHAQVLLLVLDDRLGDDLDGDVEAVGLPAGESDGCVPTLTERGDVKELVPDVEQRAGKV
jgi:hypothetical protein